LCDEILKEYEDEKKSKYVFASRSNKEMAVKDSQDFYPAQVFNNDVLFYRKSTEDFCVSFKVANHQLLNMQQIIDNMDDFYYYLIEDSAWNGENSIGNKLGLKVNCNIICVDSEKPWCLPIIGYKLKEAEDQKYAYINEFFIQKKESNALEDLLYDSKYYKDNIKATKYRECADSKTTKNCTIGALNSYFNNVDAPNEERFTLEDWKKSLSSDIMSHGIFAKAQQLSIKCHGRTYKKVVNLRYYFGINYCFAILLFLFYFQ
jgi:hypothetical protein